MRISFFNSFRRTALSALFVAGSSLALVGRAGADTPRIGTDVFHAADGADLPMRSWLPEGKPRAIIVALHGFADYSAAYKPAATLWAREGVATFAYDQRGFGAAPHVLRWSGTARMVADVSEAVAAVKARYPGVPTFLIGESMGGAVAIAATTAPEPPNVDGVVLISPAVWEHSLLGAIERSALWVAEMTVPGLWLSAPPGLHIHPSNNIEMLRGLSRDSLVQKGARADTTAGLMDLMDQAGGEVGRIRMPTLVLFGAHEEVLPHSAVTSFLARLPAHDVRVALYPNGYHMLLRDLDGDIVARDVLAWIENRAVPLPSGDECRGDAATAAPCRLSP